MLEISSMTPRRHFWGVHQHFRSLGNNSLCWHLCFWLSESLCWSSLKLKICIYIDMLSQQKKHSRKFSWKLSKRRTRFSSSTVDGSEILHQLVGGFSRYLQCFIAFIHVYVVVWDFFPPSTGEFLVVLLPWISGGFPSWVQGTQERRWLRSNCGGNGVRRSKPLKISHSTWSFQSIFSSHKLGPYKVENVKLYIYTYIYICLYIYI